MGMSCFSRPATRDGVDAPATAIAADMEALTVTRRRASYNISPMASGAVSSEPTAPLSQRLYRMLSSPDRGNVALQRDVKSSCGSFLSARSEPLSDAGSCTSGDDAGGALEARFSPSPNAASHSMGPAGSGSPALSATALLIDSPGVLGPLPDPCRSPTHRKLSGDCRGRTPQPPADSCGAGAPLRQPSRLASASRTLSDGSLRSLSSSFCSIGRPPVLDSVSSLEGDADLGPLPAVPAAAGCVPSRTSAAALLRRAAAAHAAGKLLAAEALAQQAAAASGCDTLPQLAALQQPEAAARSPADGHPSTSGSSPFESAGAIPTLSSRAGQQAAAGAAGSGSGGDGGGGAFDLRRLACEAAAARLCLQQLDATRRWPATREGGLRVQYHHNRAASTVHSVRVEAEYSWPCDRLFSVAREFDVVGSFNSFAQDHSVLAEPSAFESIVYAGTWMPFPMKPLELVLSVRWADLVQEEGIILVVLSDAVERLAGIPGAKPLPAKSRHRRRGRLLPGSCGYMRPLPPGPDGLPRTKCVIMAHMDTGIAYLPGFVVSFVLKVLSPFLFKATKRLLAESFASDAAELPQRIAAKPGLYGLLRIAEQEAVALADSGAKALRTLSCGSDALHDL